MRGLYLSLLISIIVLQSAFCGLNSVTANDYGISDLKGLSKIATSLDDKLSIVGILHGSAHSNVMAGNFVGEVKFVDKEKLERTNTTSNELNGFIVAYNDAEEKVIAKMVIDDAAIAKISKSGAATYIINGQTFKEGTWCGPTIDGDRYFSAVFELTGRDTFECKELTTSDCPAVFTNEPDVFAKLCSENDPKRKSIRINIGSDEGTAIALNYVGEDGSTLALHHLVKSGTKYFLIGSYQGNGDINLPAAKREDDTLLLHLSSTGNGLFVLLIDNDRVVAGPDITLEQQDVNAVFAQVTGDRVIVAVTIEGDDSEISISEVLKPKVKGNGVVLFDLENQLVKSTWAVAHPFGTAQLRDVLVLNNYVFLLHDQPEASLPLSSLRNVAVSVLDLKGDDKYTFVHGVTNNNLRAGAIGIDGDALLLTALNDDRGALELMFSETSLPAFMTREPLVEPPKASPIPPKPPVAPPTPPVSPPVKEEVPPVDPPVTPVAPPVDPPVQLPTEPEVPEAKSVDVPIKPEVVKDSTSTFSTSYVVVAIVILVLFLSYFGFRFWKQYRSERNRQFSRVRMEDRVREDDFYNA
eukprot:TRINITY_DN1161_c0_g1_i1.p1 TRINITY_DN1161_c0_g1~~TRINITY_DN1161_c0_g1_i1.p1  ORF type:complete len:581 (-),score=93.89 TRINITY_DN1161_c0_g1_i1:37-1779(-)